MKNINGFLLVGLMMFVGVGIFGCGGGGGSSSASPVPPDLASGNRGGAQGSGQSNEAGPSEISGTPIVSPVVSGAREISSGIAIGASGEFIAVASDGLVQFADDGSVDCLVSSNAFTDYDADKVIEPIVDSSGVAYFLNADGTLHQFDSNCEEVGSLDFEGAVGSLASLGGNLATRETNSPAIEINLNADFYLTLDGDQDRLMIFSSVGDVAVLDLGSGSAPSLVCHETHSGEFTGAPVLQVDDTIVVLVNDGDSDKVSFIDPSDCLESSNFSISALNAEFDGPQSASIDDNGLILFSSKVQTSGSSFGTEFHFMGITSESTPGDMSSYFKSTTLNAAAMGYPAVNSENQAYVVGHSIEGNSFFSIPAVDGTLFAFDLSDGVAAATSAKWVYPPSGAASSVVDEFNGLTLNSDGNENGVLIIPAIDSNGLVTLAGNDGLGIVEDLTSSANISITEVADTSFVGWPIVFNEKIFALTVAGKFLVFE